MKKVEGKTHTFEINLIDLIKLVREVKSSLGGTVPGIAQTKAAIEDYIALAGLSYHQKMAVTELKEKVVNGEISKQVIARIFQIDSSSALPAPLAKSFKNAEEEDILDDV